MEMEKAALLIVYCGAGFKGMQRNPGAATIEGALEQALVRAGGIGANGYSKNWLDWKRAARTDKEVSAAGQVVSARLYLKIPLQQLLQQVNDHLPDSIRLLGLRRMPDDFNAKSMCLARRYEYIVPAFAFNPQVHRGRKNDDQNPHQDEAEEKDFVFDDEQQQRLNSVLGRFVGTRNFHNFSWHVRSQDPEAERTVTDFRAEGPRICIQGDEFVRITVTGKSFMLHQIRKMVGLAIAVMRGSAPASIIDAALRSDVDMAVPTAPELGLLLDECIYDPAAAPASQQIPNLRNESVKAIAEFKMNRIYTEIAAGERDRRVVARWLPSLNCRNYAGFLQNS